MAGRNKRALPATQRSIAVGEDDGRAALLVNGVVQSISPEDGAARGGYWAAMLPPGRPRRALVLGLAGGTLAHLLAERWGPLERLVGVDDDLEILAVARAAGWLAVEHLEIVEADAFAYVADSTERFEFIGVDLYRGEQIARQIFSRVFLRQLSRLLVSPGWLSVNLFVDRRTPTWVERLRRVFRVDAEQIIGSNVVVHARRPPNRRA